jgi:hypothetical protein
MVPTLIVVMLALALLSVIVAKRKIESTVTLIIVQQRPLEQIFTHLFTPPLSVVKSHYLYVKVHR